MTRLLRTCGVMLAVLAVMPDVGGAFSFPNADGPVPRISPLRATFIAAQDIRKCNGLSTDKLAALAIAVTFHETGAGSNRTPSPMTLSRFDYSNRSFAFSRPNANSKRAFWHAGIGMWQYDDQGLGTSYAIGKFEGDSEARYAVGEIRTRFCADRSFSNVYRPWFACGGDGSKCAATFNKIFANGRIRNTTPDDGVGAYGGSRRTTCRFGTVVTVCLRVDPNQAAGCKAACFVYEPKNGNPSVGLSPLTYPFYVMRRRLSGDDSEIRVWLKDDTKLSSTIMARRPIGTDSRSSLVWSTTKMCDGLPTINDDC